MVDKFAEFLLNYPSSPSSSTSPSCNFELREQSAAYSLGSEPTIPRERAARTQKDVPKVDNVRKFWLKAFRKALKKRTDIEGVELNQMLIDFVKDERFDSPRNEELKILFENKIFCLEIQSWFQRDCEFVLTHSRVARCWYGHYRELFHDMMRLGEPHSSLDSQTRTDSLGGQRSSLDSNCT